MITHHDGVRAPRATTHARTRRAPTTEHFFSSRISLVSIARHARRDDDDDDDARIFENDDDDAARARVIVIDASSTRDDARARGIDAKRTKK